MRLSSLRTPPRSGAITPVLASGRSTPSDTGVAQKYPHTFCTPEKLAKHIGGSSRTSPRRPQLKSPQDKPKLAFEGTSTSHDMHREFPLPVASPSQPKLRQSHAFLPFEGESSYRREFVEKDLPRYEQMQPKIEPPVPLNAESSYTRDYTAKELERLVVVEKSPRPQQEFFGETTYRKHYSEKAVPKKLVRQKTAPATLRRTWQEPLEGASTYRTEYTEKPLPEDTRQEIPQEKKVPFQGESSYKRDFVEKELPREVPASRTEKPPLPFYGDTTYRAYHDGKSPPRSNARRKSLPPSSSPRPWADPLGGMSTYRQEFTEKQVPRDKPPEYVVESVARFDGESSYSRDYTEKPIRLEKQPDPISKPRQPFFGETSYRQSYTGKNVTLQPNISQLKHGKRPTPWNDPLNAVSSYSSDYVPHAISIVSPRQEQLASSPDLRDFSTTYSNTFVPKALQSSSSAQL
mmetsp:Transcript_90673/g.142317  ORF Transcript_90673/g.142317 Transcript_90673/m.142317 type:complete len:461 (+) Transcript_90673:45-1427(+)